MPDPSMQPQRDRPKKRMLDDAVPNSITANLSWNGTGVSISLPQVDNADPSSVSWDGSSLSRANGRYASSTSNTTNSLSATYGTETYSNSAIARNATSANLVKS